MAHRSTGVTLNKYLAQCGVCSRRAAALHVKGGDVYVNDVRVNDPGYRVHTGDVVMFDGKELATEKKVYVVLNKPIRCITTCSDEQDRRTVLDYVRGVRGTLFPVGRLDRDTTGALLLTNDGALAQTLLHPKHEKTKAYRITLDRPLTPKDLARIRNGLMLKDGFIRPDRVLLSKTDARSITMELHSGRNRIIRRMFEALSYQVKKLHRARFAMLTVRGLRPGEWRYLTPLEISILKKGGKA